jgi:alkanesulfonate monooxygenase SsuD/methylene tetrahydromethanopterin reductase-like flavin-dependent oxidoreductase (luciferase family)
MRHEMKFGLSLPIHGQLADPKLHMELAISAEKANWDGYFVWDHIAWKTETEHVPVTDPWIALAAIAAHTYRIQIGAMVIPLARRRPWKIARETVALDQLSNGRLIVGVGLGAFAQDEFEAFGEESNPKIRGAMLDEALDVLTGLWSGEPFNYQGTHFQLKDTQFLPAPSRPIPVWVAGRLENPGRRKPFRRAARFDGAFPLAPNKSAQPEAYAELKAFVDQHRPNNQPYDIVCERELSRRGLGTAQIIQPYADAGVTWWLCNGSGSDIDIGQIRDVIEQGPPIQ